jgi:hypothetical protein
MARAARGAIAAALSFALATAACTVLSGVDDMELRTGPRVVPAPDDASAPPESDSGADATNDAGPPAACATAAECQEERCRGALQVSRIETQIAKCLSVTATCKAGPPFVITPGPDHYYGADVRCTLAPQPTATALASFDTLMTADGWYGWKAKTEGAEYVVLGQTTTRRCNSY